MSKTVRMAALFLLTFLISITVNAQNSVVSGKITSTSGGNTGRVSISIKGSTSGTTSDDNGNFSLSVPSNVNFPITLVVSGINIATQEISVKSATSSLVIDVMATTTVADEIVVSATRTQTKALESPVSIERVNLNAIRNAPSANYYDIVSNLKGVDFVTSSLTFKTVTTRGFSGSGNTRFTQIVDGMDNQAPGLNFSVGSIVGLSELDVESMEMLPGASSALYGPGGMNGTLLINSKSPFKYQGLSVQIKEGIMHTDGKYRPASPFHNWSLRWAQKISDKFAFKITTDLIHAKDWLADDQRNYIRPTASNGLSIGQFGLGTRETDPNYNGANTYGDETSAPDIRPILAAVGAAAPFLQPYVNQILAEGPIPVSRTGFREADVVDPNTINYKIGGSLNYKVSSKTEIIFAGQWGTGNTVYTGSDRYSLKDLKMGQFKLEINSKNWLIRGYTTQENAGQSYNLTAASRLLNEAWKPTINAAGNGGWIIDYAQAYLLNRMNGQTNIVAHNAARALADKGMLMPGTEAYEQLYKKIRTTPISKGGALFLDKTDLWALEGQLNLTDYTKKVADILIGGNFRRFVLNSQGTLFIDTAGTIGINEYGLYATASRNFAKDKIRFTAAARYDKNENFKGRLTPRFTALIKMAKNSNLRLSFQTAYRFPSTQQQYIRLGVGGGETLLGGLPVFQQIYNFSGNPVTTLPLSAAAEKPVATFNPFKPETVNSFELGYKGLVAGDKLFIDAYGYVGEYTNFIVRTAVGQRINPALGWVASNIRTLSIPTNSPTKVKTRGAGISLEYKLGRGYTLGGNASTDVLLDVPSNFVAFFNSPKYRYNLTLTNNSLGKKKRIGASIIYRWQESFFYESDFVSGAVPSYHVLDAQISYKFPAIKSLVSIGANNLLNQYYITATGNPSIGGIYYARFAYNIF